MHCLSLHKDPMRALSISSCCCTGLSWLLERFSSRESLETASMAFLFWWGMCSYSPCWKKTRGTLNPKHVQITNPHTMIPAPHRWMTWVTLSGWSFIAISLGDHHLHCHLQTVSCIVVLIATIERFLLRLVPAEVRKIAFSDEVGTSSAAPETGTCVEASQGAIQRIIGLSGSALKAGALLVSQAGHKLPGILKFGGACSWAVRNWSRSIDPCLSDMNIYFLNSYWFQRRKKRREGNRKKGSPLVRNSHLRTKTWTTTKGTDHAAGNIK